MSLARQRMNWHDILRKIDETYRTLTERIQAKNVAAEMFEDNELDRTDLTRVQQAGNDVDAAIELVNVIRNQPTETKTLCFINALDKNDDIELYLLLTLDYEAFEEHQKCIQDNYVNLRDQLVGSQLTPHLYENKILTKDDCEEITSLRTTREQNECLLRKLLRKTYKQYLIFRDTLRLRDINQGHIADVLTAAEHNYNANSRPTAVNRKSNEVHVAGSSRGNEDMLRTRPPLPPRSSYASQRSGESSGCFVRPSSPIHCEWKSIFPSDCNGDAIRGMTYINKCLFVLRMRTRHQIDVFDVKKDSLILQRQLPVPVKSAHHLSDMTSCCTYRRIYVSHSSMNCIFVLDLNFVSHINDTSWRQWKTTESPWGMSVTSSGYLLVTMRYAGRIDLFSPEGEKCDSVSLQSLNSPWHAIQLCQTAADVNVIPERLVVGHGETDDDEVRVCIYDTRCGGDGVVLSFGSQSREGEDRLSRPQHLVLSSDDKRTLAVTDVYSDRVMLFNDQLERIGIVNVQPDDEGVEAGWLTARVCWLGHRLAVAEVKSVNGKLVAGRVTVYQCQVHGSS